MSIFTDMLPATLLVNKTKKENLAQKRMIMCRLGVSWWLFTKQQLQKYKHGQIPGQYAQRHHDV